MTTYMRASNNEKPSVLNRSIIRHALYRAKNGIMVEDKKFIYDMVQPNIPENDSWATFAVTWDIFYKDGNITVIKPEMDYDFIHTTCLEKALHVKNNIEMDATDRQLNTIQIVELNMLDDKMSWPTYNKSWGVSVDHELKRINTRLFLTFVNEVTEEMIKQSAPSDGTAMTALPEIPVADMGEMIPMTDAEVEEFNASITKKDRKRR